MTISDHDIQAYVDGELAPADAARIEAAVAADVMVAARVEREKRLRAQLRGAYDPVLQEPVPDRFRALLARGGDTPSDATDPAAHDVVALRPRAAGISERWRAPVFALAASVAALAVSMWLRPGADVRMDDGVLVARGALAHDLDGMLAGRPDTDTSTSVGLTFRDVGGRICRSFASADAEVAGLACRDGRRWVLPVVSRLDARGEGEIRQASSAIPPEVQAAVDARLQGDVFDAAQERAARDAGWR